jgi:hypothetical protein
MCLINDSFILNTTSISISSSERREFPSVKSDFLSQKVYLLIIALCIQIAHADLIGGR